MTESKRERLRRERQEAEANQRSAADRARMFKLVGAVATAAVLLVAVLVVVSQSGSDEPATPDASALLEGIPQQGSVLGNPSAETRLVEYGDMQCPHCRDFANTVMPEIIEGPVRDGELQVQFKNWIVIGPESADAAKATMAAGEQDRYWQFLHAFYADDVPDTSLEGLRAIAEEAGVPDLEAWEESLDDPAWEKALQETDQEAANLGFGGTPSFAVVEGNKDPVPIQPPESVEDLQSQLGNA